MSGVAKDNIVQSPWPVGHKLLVYPPAIAGWLYVLEIACLGEGYLLARARGTSCCSARGTTVLPRGTTGGLVFSR